jgi:hypothetical protein
MVSTKVMHLKCNLTGTMPSRGEDPNDESIANNTSNTEQTVDETKGVVHHGFHIIRKCQPV